VLASAISTVASPNFMVSPPLATTICFSGTPSFFATSIESGAPTTGAPVCLAIVPMSEMWSKCAWETKIASAFLMSSALKPMLCARGVRLK